MVWIKVCGLTNHGDVQTAIANGVNAVGFIFAPSVRQVTPEQVKEMVEQIPDNIERIGVFMNHEADYVEEVAKYCGLSGLQFHGIETPEYCKRFTNYKVIKAFRVDAAKGWDKILPYIDAGAVDRILLDTYIKGVAGGTGKAFPWSLVNSMKNWGDTPVIVAGGINLDNVCQLLEQVEIFGIDVGSGVESSPGKKDEKKIKQLVERVYSRGGH